MSSSSKPTTRAEVIALIAARVAARGPAKAGSSRVFRHAKPRDPAPALPRSNGGPAMYPDAAAELRDIGRTLHGEAWIKRLAFDAAVEERTLRRWAAGTGHPTPDANARARREVATRLKDLAALARRLGLDADEGSDDLAPQRST